MKTTALQADRTSSTHLLTICALYVALIGIFILALQVFTKDRLTELLKYWAPWNFRINLALLLGGLVICYRDMREAAGELFNRRGVLLALLLVFGFLVVFFVPERAHRIYFDEDIYANVGQVMATANKSGFCNYGTFEYGELSSHWIEYNKEPGGWPFLISLAFQVLGVNELYAFLLNNLFLVGSILLTFLITLEITARFSTSLWAALVFASIPHGLIWSNTAAAEPSAAFFVGAVVYVLLVFMRTGADRFLFLLAAILPLACQMRPESGLICFWALAAVLVTRPQALGKQSSWMIGFVAAVLVLPHLLHLYAVSDNSWGANGPRFAMSFFLPNLKANGIYYLDNRYFPVVFTALSLVGAFVGRQASLGSRCLLALWFALFWGIFLFFYAGSYDYGADERFSLLSFMPLAVLAGIGIGAVSEALSRYMPGAHATAMVAIVVALSFIGFLPLVRTEGQEAWGARYDHSFVQQAIGLIPRRSVVITQIPMMHLLSGQGAIQTYAAVNDPELIEGLLERYQGHVYFHYNFWCNAKSKENTTLCQKIEEIYDLEEIFRAGEQNYEYGLYKVSIKKKAEGE